MCYINGVKVSLAEYIRYKQQQKELKHLNNYLHHQPAKKGFDYSDWPIIKPSTDGCDWDIVAMEWGYLPPYLKTRADVEKFRKGYVNESGKFITPMTTLNAMSEELLLPNKMYRQSALTRRCLVLSSGFYEHRHVIEIGKKGLPLKTPKKYPYHITVQSKPFFMIAGIYTPWIDTETGEVKDTFALCTTKANPLMEQVHNSKMRMPTILTDELADEWSNPNLTEKRIIEIATNIYPAEDMSAYTVSKSFLEDADPTEAFVYPQLPELIY